MLFLFTLMTNRKTFLQTATLIEDILGVKKVRVILVLNPQHESVKFMAVLTQSSKAYEVSLCGDTFGKPVIFFKLN